MQKNEQREAIKNFVEFWSDKGYEKGESQKFWLHLLSVLEVEHPEQYISFEDKVHLDHTSFIDGYIEKTHVMIEQKSSKINLNQAIKQSDGTMLTPFQQAKRYANDLPYSKKPRWVITCNFREFYIYDMERPNCEPEIIQVKDLEKDFYRLQFLVNAENENLKKEMEVSIKAGEVVGLFYDELLKQYIDKENEETLKSLNKLCVRLVFCLYAEDSGVFPKRNQFLNYMKQFEAKHFRTALIELFKVLDTPYEQRDKYLDKDLMDFPYVNGGLFTNDDNIEIPQFTEEIIDLILTKASADFDWSEISPTIFGAVFESTLNPETRRSGGMHYTSIENIHKVINPLFMNDLNNEFETICNGTNEKTKINKLKEFQTKISELTFLDPACGSGNFLTETYISLRKLENKILETIQKDQITMGAILNPIKVSIQQFYGIEINDFAVTVAKTALWIAESQMLKQTENIVHMDLDFLPLKSYTNIVEGNALRIDWKTVVAKDKLNYIMGNPPFVGYSLQSKEQKSDLLNVFGANWKNVGKLDFVSCWYKKAVDYMATNTHSLVEPELSLSSSPLAVEDEWLNTTHNIKVYYPLEKESNLSLSPSPLVGEGRGEGLKATHFYTKQALEYSKELRKNMTDAEKILWFYLRNRQLNGLKFRRQEAFDKYVLDFVCYECKIVIELDGGEHLEEKQKEHDIERDNFITQNGFTVLRIFNNEVFNNIEGVIDFILEHLSNTPHPSPLPQRGEGTTAHSSISVRDDKKAYSPLVGESKSLISVRGNNIKCAFVSTNSICQGEQVAILWKPLFEKGIHIDFAHTTFRWDSEASLKAHVHCVIVGFSCSNIKEKYLYSNDRVQKVDNINAYLIDAQDIFIENRTSSICNVPIMTKGNIPVDGGNLIIEANEYDDFIKKNPLSVKYIKELVGADEFINNSKRYCLWLLNANPADIKKSPLIIERIEKVKEMRLASTKAATRNCANYPTQFMEIRQPDTDYLLVPSTTSENRKYIPIGYISKDVITTNANFLIPSPSLYLFGVLTSNVHMAWTKVVCGRLKSDYRYSNTIVYNNFVWCEPTKEQKEKIEKTAQGILDARAKYPECSLADLYDDLTMPPELRKAHQENDKAVMEAYGFRKKDSDGKYHWFTESETVAKLMEMYQEKTK